ncbi:putative reverse transcriptase domain-containing protein [Tanacetum coccineum]
MDAPPSPNHVFNHPEDDPAFDEEEFEEDPQEDPEEEPAEEDPEEAQQMDFDFGLWDEDEEDDEAEIIYPMRLRDHPTLHLLFLLILSLRWISREFMLRGLHERQLVRTQRDLYEMTDWAHGFYEGILRIGAVRDRPSESIDMLAVYGEIMPPKMLKRKAVTKMVKKQVAKAIAEYERTKVNPGNAIGSGSVNAGGIDASKVHGCTYKTFLNCQPHKFNGTEGVVGLKRWFKKMEQVFEISKCAEEDKLALMCLDLVTPEKKKIERYIQGLPERVKENVTSSKPASLHDAINMARELVEQAIQAKATRIGESNKRNTSSRTGDKKLPRRILQPQLMVGAMLGTYHGETVVTHTIMVNALQSARDVKDLDIKRLPRHFRNKYPNRTNQSNEGAHGRAYVMGTENPQQNPNVFTGTFLLNNHYASIVFDSYAEKSFVSIEFTPFIDIAPASLDTSYEVELADGKVLSTNTILRGCTLALFNHCFKIDLLPNRLGSFDVIVGMDWLSYHHAVIVCYEKIVHVQLPNGEILKIQGERPEKDLRSLSYIKANEKKVEDIPIVHDFPDIFPDDLSGLPPVREIEFRIDLISGALPVVKLPYRLAPSKILELSNQLKELQEKGFIRPSHSPE